MSRTPTTNKTTTYLAAFGAFSLASFVVMTPAFFSLPVLALASLPVALNPNRKEMLNRIGEEAKTLWQDFKSYASDDLARVRTWWAKKPETVAAEPVRAQTAEESSAFKADATMKPSFDKNAQPGAEQKTEAKPAPKPAPAAKPNGPQ